MKKQISKKEFKGTKEQETELRKVIEEHKDQEGAVLPVLQKAQAIYGYLPQEVQMMIAEGLGVPLENVYGVSTFYSQFSLTPKGKYNFSVCLGTACYVKGSSQILDKLTQILKIGSDECTPDGQFSISECRCVGACGLAPVMMVNDEVYGRVRVDDLEGIVDKYRNV